ncbi:hypothetical protein RC98_10380 [Pectobacterium carotovorum subsp. carotovorum]|uniref:hypothetical protein n=1 Tax=Pectobacterium carotovorum TaxID=554 RepID=UPI00057DBFA0|nr:hypothetical protein [Pectobacterium carotovorum]KHT27394.1 hypothetical protein RC98_10380 [Pectobacterium carotovorum subsp. carotovorum]
MAENKKWKEKLISSSFPLEYLASRKLATLDIAVENDFSYSRDDAGILKDFSIDLNGSYWNEDCSYYLNFLIECKQRHDKNKWLFMNDPNTSEFSSHTLGYTLRAVDDFSYIDFPPNATIELDEKMAFVVKGIEIDTSNGNVYDNEIKHGISQLAYSLPDVMIWQIAHSINSHPEDNIPFFFVPILLTTSELFVTHDDFSMDKIREAQDVSDIADNVPYLIMEYQHTPGFGTHRAKRFSAFDYLLDSPQLHVVNEIRKKHGKYSFTLPEKRLIDLSSQPHLCFNEYFSQIIICSLPNLDELVKSIIKITGNAMERSIKLT